MYIQLTIMALNYEEETQLFIIIDVISYNFVYL